MSGWSLSTPFFTYRALYLLWLNEITIQKINLSLLGWFHIMRDIQLQWFTKYYLYKDFLIDSFVENKIKQQNWDLVNCVPFFFIVNNITKMLPVLLGKRLRWNVTQTLLRDIQENSCEETRRMCVTRGESVYAKSQFGKAHNALRRIISFTVLVRIVP